MALKEIYTAPECGGKFNVDFSRESKQTFFAFFDPADDMNYVRLHCGLTIGGRHPTDVQQVLLSYSYDFEESTTWDHDGSDANLWKIVAEYGPWNPAEKGDPAQAADPISMRPRYHLEWERVPEPVWNDINGKPILNTAGQPFDPPIERSGLVGILTVERNEKNPNLALLMSMAETINTSTWNGFAAKCVRFAPPAFPELQYSQEQMFYYYPMVYVFEINPRNWQAKPLQCGLVQCSPTQINPNRTIPIVDDSGQPIQTPGLLDKNGAWLKPPVPASQVLYGKFDIYQDSDFSVFNLDTLFTPPPPL